MGWPGAQVQKPDQGRILTGNTAHPDGITFSQRFREVNAPLCIDYGRKDE